MTALSARTIVRDMANPVHERIRRRLDALGMNPRQASLQAGGSADLLRNLFRREHAMPSAQSLKGLAGALHTTEAWLLHEHGPEDTRTQTGGASAFSPEGSRLPARTEGFSLLSAVPLAELNAMMPLDLPVVGTAAGSLVASRGGFEIEARIIDTVRRPPALMGVAEAYAILVTGRSMEPEHRQGDLRFVNPKIRPSIGDSVVLSTQNAESEPPEGYLGHLLRRSTTKITLGKLNPETTIDFAAEYVLSTHKILSLNDLFDV